MSSTDSTQKTTFGEIAENAQTVGMIDFQFDIGYHGNVQNIVVKCTKIRDDPINTYKVHHDILKYIRHELTHGLLFDVVPGYEGECYGVECTEDKMEAGIFSFPDLFEALPIASDDIGDDYKSTKVELSEKTDKGFDVFYDVRNQSRADNSCKSRITFVIKTIGG